MTDAFGYVQEETFMRSKFRRLMFAGLLTTFLATTSLTSLAAKRHAEISPAEIFMAEQRRNIRFRIAPRTNRVSESRGPKPEWETDD